MGGCCAPPPFWGAGPHLTQCGLGRGPTSIPSGIWIHPNVWPQYTNVTDRQTGQTDNGPLAYVEPFYKRPLKNRRIDRHAVQVVDSGGPKEACITATWRIRLNHPCVAAMRPFCQMTLTTRFRVLKSDDKS